MIGTDVEKDPQTSSWHLDKRIPIALIIALLTQTAAAIWWASSIEARMLNVERASMKTENLPSVTSLVQYRLDQIDSKLNRIENRLDTPTTPP